MVEIEVHRRACPLEREQHSGADRLGPFSRWRRGNHRRGRPTRPSAVPAHRSNAVDCIDRARHDSLRKCERSALRLVRPPRRANTGAEILVRPARAHEDVAAKNHPGDRRADEDERDGEDPTNHDYLLLEIKPIVPRTQYKVLYEAKSIPVNRSTPRTRPLPSSAS